MRQTHKKEHMKENEDRRGRAGQGRAGQGRAGQGPGQGTMARRVWHLAVRT